MRYDYRCLSMGKLLVAEAHLNDWVEAAEGIHERYGINKALGYVIGEKFYNLLHMSYTSQQNIRDIEKKRKEPDYNSIQEVSYGDYKHVRNYDEIYKDEQDAITEIQELLPKFALLIKEAFQPYQISEYFKSHPRLGTLGHTTTEEVHDLFIEKGVIEHSIETEVEDAFILGDMMKYFGIAEEFTEREELFGFYDDDGNKIDPELVPKPSLCVTCKKNDVGGEEIHCILNRNDQRNERDFKCDAYEPKVKR